MRLRGFFTGAASAAGGSNADATSLQPAGNNPLQSTNQDSTGLTAPNANTLQAPSTTNEQLEVIMGDVEGTSTSPSETEETNLWGWLIFTVVFALIATAVGWWLHRQYRRRRPAPAYVATTPDTEPPADDQPEDSVAPEPSTNLPASDSAPASAVDAPVADEHTDTLAPSEPSPAAPEPQPDPEPASDTTATPEPTAAKAAIPAESKPAGEGRRHKRRRHR